MKKFWLIFFSIILGGCMTPSQRFDQRALKLGLKSQQVSSAQFQHKIYFAKNFTESNTVHVYLDGDGTPWVRGRWVADDPTARNPLILQLMSQDSSPAILFGRPCYYGLSHTAGCNNKFWTSHRYSKEIVDSLSQALNGWLNRHDFKEVIIIGYSGGGTLAILMADKIKRLSTVVTVAANLDVITWSTLHGYLALKQSLNPADEMALNPQIKQIHFAGKEDKVVPSSIIKAYSDKQKNAKYYELSGQDHACCWHDDWKELLRRIK